MAISKIDSSKNMTIISNVQEMFIKVISLIKDLISRIFAQISLFSEQPYESNFYNFTGHLFYHEKNHSEEELLIHSTFKLIGNDINSILKSESSQQELKSNFEKLQRQMDPQKFSNFLEEALKISKTYNDNFEKEILDKMEELKNIAPPKTELKTSIQPQVSRYPTLLKASLIGVGLIIFGFGLYRGYSAGFFTNLFSNLPRSSIIPSLNISQNISNALNVSNIVNITNSSNITNASNISHNLSSALIIS